jgi:hypothetical protein
MSLPTLKPLAYMGIKEKDPPEVIKSTRAPGASDVNYDIGDIWINTSLSTTYMLTSKLLGVATWVVLGGSSTDVNTLSGDAGGNLSPTGGNIQIAGGTNIGTTGAGSVITVNLDAAITVDSVATSPATAGMTISATDIDADGTDASISLTVTPKGPAGQVVIDNGGLSITNGDIQDGTSAARITATTRAFSADGNAIQSYCSTTGGTAGTTYRAVRGDLLVLTGDGSESPQGVRGNCNVGAAGDIEEAYGGFFMAQQTNASAIDSNLIGSLGMANVLEANAADQPQQWISGTQSIVSFDAGAAVPTAAIVAGSLSHVTYDTPMNTLAHGYVASRNGGGAGGTAAAAYKVVIGGGIDDWQYGLDLYTGSLSNNYSVSDIRLSQQNDIKSVAGFPTGTSSAGTLAIRSNGPIADNVLYVNNDGTATGWRPVLRANTTWIEHFTQSPIMQSNADTGAVPSGATGDVNLMCLQGGEIMQQFIIGAGQTIRAPRMDAIGLLVSLDLTNTEGAEYNWGMTPVSKHAYTVGTSPAIAFIMSFAVADVTGANPILMGFRKQQANNGTYTNYTDYALIGLNNGVNPGTIIIEDRLNTGAAVQTNTTNAWVDGGNHTLRVNVSNTGVVTYSIDGVAPAVTHAFTFDNGDVIRPFFHFVHGAAAPGAIEWTDMVCGPV